MTKTHWKKLTDTNYIGHWDLDGDLTVKITKVEKKQIQSQDGTKEWCLVAHLDGHKPMILNKTNAKTIEKIFKSGFIEDWTGKQIILYRTRVKSFGDMVDALRIRTRLPQS